MPVDAAFSNSRPVLKARPEPVRPFLKRAHGATMKRSAYGEASVASDPTYEAFRDRLQFFH